MPWINEIKKPFLPSRWVSEIFEFVTAIYWITIREVDVSDGGLSEVHRHGFVVVDC